MASQCARSLITRCCSANVRHSALTAAVGRSFRTGPAGTPHLTAGARAEGPLARPALQRRPLCQAATGGGSGAGAGSGSGGGGSGKPVSMGGSGEPAKPDGPINGFVAWYMGCLGANPLLTKAITCALLNALGDLLSQLVIEKGTWNPKRTTTFTLLGLLLVGPTLHFWYSILNTVVPAKNTTAVLTQLFLDQGLFAPGFIALFTSVLFTVEGNADKVVAKLKQDWWEMCQANWVLWIPAQFVNFRFVPPNLQVLTVNIVALAWNAYVSWKSNKAVAVA